MGKYSIENQDNYLLEHNLLGATSYDELEQLEAVAFSIRATQLEEQGFHFLFPITIASMKQLHYYLFQDIYPFAGKIREVQLMKEETRFCQAEFIEKNLKNLLFQLQEEPVWQSMGKAAGRLAFYKSELNMIHPFREGNGRVIRIVIRELALRRGLDWEFSKIERSLYIRAMIRSVIDDKLLKELFMETLITKEN